MPKPGNLPAVRDAVHARMKKLNMSDPELLRRTRLAEGTINNFFTGQAPVRDATMVLISFALGWPGDYLVNIHRGEEHKNETSASVAENEFEKLVRQRLDELGAIAKNLDEKLDRIIDVQYSDGES